MKKYESVFRGVRRLVFPAWLKLDRLSGEMRISKESPAGRRQFEQMMERRRGQEEERDEWKRCAAAWCLGDQRFRKELPAQSGVKVRKKKPLTK